MKVDRVKMVESFLENETNKADFDYEIERQLTRHRLCKSMGAKTLNIWKYGEYTNEEGNEEVDDKDIDERGYKKRNLSITNVLPQLEGADTSGNND